MPTIRLNNIRKTITDGIFSQDATDDGVLFKDLHLDLEIQKNIGRGENPVDSNDLRVDVNAQAIKNSIRNIFSTRKGQKLLTPEFGASLDQHLFEKVDKFYGNMIGEEILRNLTIYEPRIDVKKVFVVPIPDKNQYNIKVEYTFNNFKKVNEIVFSLLNDGQIYI
jgi:phage baseplate assembly protein W